MPPERGVFYRHLHRRLVKRNAQNRTGGGARNIRTPPPVISRISQVDLFSLTQYTQKDSNPPADGLETQAIPQLSSTGAAQSGAVTTSDPLAAFVASLTPEQRARFAALLTGSGR